MTAATAGATAGSTAGAPVRPTSGYVAREDQLVTRLHRVEGQVRGLARMVEDGRPCVDVLTQISAATKALQQVALGLLDDHLRHCVREAAKSDPDIGASRLDEVTLELGRLLRI